MMAKTRYANIDMSESLLVAAVPLLAGAAALAVPLPRGIDGLGAPNIAGASAVVVLLVLATRGGPRKRAEVASFLAVTAIAVTAAATAFGYGWSYWVPAGAIAFGLIVVTNAAKLTVAVARIALPPIPAPGESVTNDELLDPVSVPEATDEESPTWQAIIASVPESAARLTERSRLAKQLLIGFVTAGASVLSVGAITVVVQGHFFVHSMIVAGLVTVVCGFRSRLYAERWCAWALLGAAVGDSDGCGDAPVPPGIRDMAWLILGALRRAGAGRADHRRRDVGRASGLAGDQADPRTARRCGDRRGHPAAAVDRERVRHPAQPAVLSEVCHVDR